jgi:hypothetical protein
MITLIEILEYLRGLRSSSFIEFIDVFELIIIISGILPIFNAKITSFDDGHHHLTSRKLGARIFDTKDISSSQMPRVKYYRILTFSLFEAKTSYF